MPRPGPARAARILTVWTIGVLAVFGVGRAVIAMPQHCGTGEPAQWRTAAEAAVGWFAVNQRPDGTFLYRYDADAGVEVDDYNWVRHAGVLLSLEQAETAGIGDPGPVADRARQRALRNIAWAGDVAAYTDGRSPTAGGTALLVAALAERREHRGDPTDDELLFGLGRYLVAQVQPDGQVDEYSDPVTLAPARGTPSIFTTSEVAFALARLERLFPGQGFGDPVRTITHYVSTRRALDAHVVPDLGDHWMSYAMSEIVRWPDPAAARLTDDELAWARKQMGIVGVMTRFESQRTHGWQDVLRRGRTSIGSAVGTHGEALNGWVAVASIEPSLHSQLANVVATTQCNAGLLAERQRTPEEAERATHPERVSGAWFWRGVTQMDDQQHALSALAMAVERVDPASTSSLAVAGGGQLPRRAPVPASPWLMFVVALAALNPLRLGLAGTGRRADDPDGWMRVAGAGALGVVVLAAFGLAGDWVWRTLDVSIPVGVIGGALAVTVAALATAILPFPRVAEGDRRGWRGWVVPHLIPLTLRPDLLALTLAAGAGGRGWPFALGLLVAVAIATALARLAPGTGAIATWLARVVAVVALVGGVAMIIDAIYAV